MAFRAMLIGCGLIGSLFADDPKIQGVLAHAHAYAVCPDTKLIAVCDTNPQAAEHCALRWDVPLWGTDPVRLLEEVRPDIVSVCSPDDTHYAILSATLATPSVRGVLAEKPLAMDAREAAELVNLARKQKVALAVNYCRRYAAGHVQLREDILAGALGRIQRVSGFYTKGTLHNGTHWFDLARFLLGEVVSLRAWNLLGEEGADPTLDAMISFGDGVVASLQALDSRIFSLFEMDIMGTLGRARLVDSGHWIERFRSADSPYYSGYKTLVAEGRGPGVMEDCTLRAVQDLVNCVQTGRPPVCSGEDALRALEIGLALHSSAREGGKDRAPGAAR